MCVNGKEQWCGSSLSYYAVQHEKYFLSGFNPHITMTQCQRMLLCFSHIDNLQGVWSIVRNADLIIMVDDTSEHCWLQLGAYFQFSFLDL